MIIYTDNYIDNTYSDRIDHCFSSKLAGRIDQSAHKFLKLLPRDLVLQISHTQEVFSCLLLRNAEGSGHTLEPCLFDDWLLSRAITIEDTIGQLAEVLFIAVLGHVL